MDSGITHATRAAAREQEISQVQYNDQMVNVPVEMRKIVPTIHAVEKTVEVPQSSVVERPYAVPQVVRQVVRQVPVPQVQYVNPVLKMQRQVLVIQTVQKPVNVPKSTFESNPAGSNGDVTWTSAAVTPGDEPSLFESTPQQHTACDDACRCSCCRAV